LNILTGIDSSIMLEVYANVPKENIFSDPYFIKYVTGWAKLQQGRMLSQFNFTLPGGITYNGADMVTQGQAEMDKVEEDIKGQSTSAWFIMTKK